MPTLERNGSAGISEEQDSYTDEGAGQGDQQSRRTARHSAAGN